MEKRQNEHDWFGRPQRADQTVSALSSGQTTPPLPKCRPAHPPAPNQARLLSRTPRSSGVTLLHPSGGPAPGRFWMQGGVLNVSLATSWSARNFVDFARRLWWARNTVNPQSSFYNWLLRHEFSPRYWQPTGLVLWVIRKEKLCTSVLFLVQLVFTSRVVML